MARDRVTIFAGVPTMFTALLSVPEPSRFDLASLTVCVSGGASLPLEVLRSFEEEFGASILEGYGLTETSALGAFNPRDRRKAGSVGLPVGGAEIRIVDKDGMDVSPGTRGELVLRAPFLTPGYWQRPEATAEAMRGGWFHTGDIATADEDGYLYIVDRMKDLIIRGGYNVYPREIEEVLYEHPGVREAAVIGFAHPLLGEEIAAVVVLNGDVRVTGDELREYVKERVAAYKYPRRVAIVDELPKGPTGKILKRLIELPSQADTGGVSA
jgi:long-chain acyl-CoA synthetase